MFRNFAIEDRRNLADSSRPTAVADLPKPQASKQARHDMRQRLLVRDMLTTRRGVLSHRPTFFPTDTEREKGKQGSQPARVRQVLYKRECYVTLRKFSGRRPTSESTPQCTAVRPPPSSPSPSLHHQVTANHKHVS